MNYDSSDLNDYYDGVDRRATHNWFNSSLRPNRFELSAEKNEIGLILDNDPSTFGNKQSVKLSDNDL